MPTLQIEEVVVGARGSTLSRKQVEEAAKALPQDVVLKPVWVETKGDRDQESSLRELDKTDFFTKEIDALLLEGHVRIAIHSAKDLPDPLPDGLEMFALTRGVDSRDALVLRDGEEIGSGSVIATSSERREAAVRKLFPDVVFSDIRGTIEKRLAKLYCQEVDGVVIAEAALIRLGLTGLNRIYLPGETAENQGKLAVVGRAGDQEMRMLFSSLDCRT